MGLCGRGGAASESFVEPSRGSREASCIVVGPSWTVLGLSEAVPEPSFSSLGPLWIPLRALWSFLGRSWSRPGPPCSGPGVLLRLSGDVFRRRRSCVLSLSRNHAKTSKKPMGNSRNQRSPGSSGSFFWLSYRPPGLSWGSAGSSGPESVLSWRPLGGSAGAAGQPVKASWAVSSLPRGVLQCCGSLLDCLRAVWCLPGALFGRSEALLEPSVKPPCSCPEVLSELS